MEHTQTKRQPLISVIMPAWQAERYIGQAIESVLDQSCGQPFELLVIDDCSRDHTAEVVKKYLSDSRVRYLRQTRNLGVAAARNRGIREARGTYVAFLDADDWWDRDKLKRQMACIRKTGAVLCFTARELVRPDGTSTGRQIPVPGRVTYRQLLKTNVIPCGSVLLRTDVAREYGFVHDEYHEDYILWLKILKKYGAARGINIPALKCRLSAGGKSRNKWKSAKMQYGVYRYLGFSPIAAFFYMGCYMINGIRKYS